MRVIFYTVANTKEAFERLGQLRARHAALTGPGDAVEEHFDLPGEDRSRRALLRRIEAAEVQTLIVHSPRDLAAAAGTPEARERVNAALRAGRLEMLFDGTRWHARPGLAARY